jgi:hypothetical protein
MRQDPRERLLAKFRKALNLVRTQPEQCKGDAEFVRGLDAMLVWVIEAIEVDQHNEVVDRALFSLTGKRLAELEKELPKEPGATVTHFSLVPKK